MIRTESQPRSLTIAARMLSLAVVAAAGGGCGGAGNGHAVAPGFTAEEYARVGRAPSPKVAYLTWKAAAAGSPADAVRGADEDLAAGGNPFHPNDATAVRSGRLVYAAHCASCHGDGADGRGPAMAGQYLPAMDFRAGGKSHAIFFRGGRTPRKWFDRVHDGVTSKARKPDGSLNQMPPFRDTLSNEQVWLSLTYLHGVVTGVPAAR